MTQSFDFKLLAKLRKKKRLTIEKLASRSGISYSTIADIERNKVTPNLETLNKIATAMELRTSDLLSMVEGNQTEIFKRGEYVRVSGFNMEVFTMPSMRFIYATSPQAHSSDGRLSSHPNFTELMYIISGSCKLVLDGVENILSKGEMIRFEGFQQHYYEAIEDDTSLILIHQSK